MEDIKTIQNRIKIHDQKRGKKVITVEQEIKRHKAENTKKKTFMPFHNFTGDVQVSTITFDARVI